MKIPSAILSLTCLTSLVFGELPIPTDPETTVTKFAGSDLIKHPIGMTFTHDGKLLAVESHTHLRPKQYNGPESDQIIWLRDTDGDGKADRRSVFYGDQLRATMNIATHPITGAIYVATKNGIVRLWDRNKNGKADLYTAEKVIDFVFDSKFLDNGYGCAGLAFDDQGNLLFGIGGLLGAPYTLTSADGVSFSDQGEGGNIWKCTDDGKELRRFATGFWNPFGLTHVEGGHVFVTDNDPSSRPPSRLHHVIDGGDYGYQYRYGRSGRHPFIAWDGELPGTLPMLSGTGDAPCDVLFHQGNLLVASWCDHIVEVFPLNWNRTHFETESKILLKGGVDFRPVGFAVGEDSSLYISDWVKGDYQLHGEGTIWKVDNWEPEPRDVGATTPPPLDTDSEDPWTFSRMISNTTSFQDVSRERKPILDLLSARFHNKSEGTQLIRAALADREEDETLRLLALKWISDQKLEGFDELVVREIENPVSATMFHAAITTKARIDGLQAMDEDIEKLFTKELNSDSPLARRAAFLLIENRQKIDIATLKNIYNTGDEEMRSGVALSLKGHTDPEGSLAMAREIIANDEFEKVKAFASLSSEEIPEIKPKHPLELGEFLFHQNCAKCHLVNGFGRRGGPDLSRIGIRGREHIVRSVREPSAEISPQYETWKVNMADGTEHVGFVLGEIASKHFYSDAAGNEFTINTVNMVDRERLPASLMPAGLDEQIGQEDFKYLVEWLEQLK